ncbi:MAG: L-seryl-tRNA(Sec) selenium transferase [Chloroflexi bacterium]|nr:L-seryl-tRNA(Sec) selenium transferase [Chloroflexota bacterium]
MTSLRNLPSVEQLLQTRSAAELVARYGRPLTLSAIRSALDRVRKHVSKGGDTTLPDRDGLLAIADETLQEWTHPTLLPVINASGVILHTNLGRAPLSAAALTAMETVAHCYSTLEFDLATGKRGSRLVHAEGLLQRLTGAEAALVVNNNAAAVLLVLSALANRKRVVIARSQLVEIGGGFRIPDVMKQSGAKLVEVGTTNKVRISDYEDALAEPAGLVMRAHRSNFQIIGFTEEPELKELAGTAHRFQVPCVDDLGSGTLLDTAKFGMSHEPTIQESLAAGADVVCFSGDKLLGGPQAGIIIGKADLLARVRKHPLARAVRLDKLCLAALTATLLHYLKDEAEREIPIWRMIATTPEQVKARAEAWALELGQGNILESESTVGGGSLPGETLPTFVLALTVKSVEKFLESLRQGQPPVIARTEGERILLDPRTVLPEQDGALLVNLMNAMKKPAGRVRG